ncbi:MAG: VWA domain-containing protein [Candidatus Hydrogenedentes bacterium]|nr:VWA domain-containing protein [Candidatus Hydrogenedentota bacterium]
MNLMNAFMFNMLTSPWVLLLLPLPPVLFLLEAFAGAPGAMTISTGDVLARLRGRGREWARRLPPLLRCLGLCALIVALAGPLHGFQVRKDRANVIDILLCVDVSGSMAQRDFVVGGEYRDRLYVTKQAVYEFLQSRKEGQNDRFGMDRIGLVLYAGYAWTAVPLTLDYEILERELQVAQIENTDRQKEGTAIGSAIGLAVSRLKESEAKSKVMVLLTDGLNNRGELDPITAATVAKQYGIRIYTIGAGSTKSGLVPGLIMPQLGQAIDEKAMQKIADTTGGKYFRATDLDSLVQAYDEINQMETTEIEVGDYYEYKAAFMPYLLLGTLALLLGLLARRQWFEVLP